MPMTNSKPIFYRRDPYTWSIQYHVASIKNGVTNLITSTTSLSQKSDVGFY